MDRSSRSVPSGPGSRGGRWHDPEFRNAYQRRWRANNPEYRDRELLRLARRRAIIRGDDPTAILGPIRITPGRLPGLATSCSCECGCTAEIPRICGFCSQGLHDSA